MTNEEAIEAIKCNWPDSRYTILREALDMAVKALEDVTDKNVGKNEPLTLNELRDAAQTGDPVWLVRANCSSWVVIEKVDDRKYIQLVDYAEFGSDEPYDFAISDYGDSSKAYRHKPEEDKHSICGATNLPCIRCNPGGCDNRKEGAD